MKLRELAALGLVARCWMFAIACVWSCSTAIAQIGLGPVVPSTPTGAAQGLTDQIEQTLRQMVTRYQELDSYQDAGQVWVSQTTGRICQTTQMPSSIVFRRPNLLQVVGGAQSISCDGQTVQIVLDNLRQYTLSPAPERLVMDHVRMGAPGGGLDEGYPEVLEFLLGQDVYQRWLGQIAQISMAQQQQTVDERLCDVIHYTTVYQASVTMYIDAASSLLLRCQIDATKALYSPGTPPPGPDDPKTRLEIRYEMFPVKVGHEILAASFKISEPKGMQRVSSFQAQVPSSTPEPNRTEPLGAAATQSAASSGLQALVGQAVPEFKGTDLEGGSVQRKDLNGKVSLIFFWSPDGGAESLSAIQMVQRVAEHFRDEPSFHVLGISGVANHPELVGDLLRAKRATYRNILDPDGLVMRSFGVQDLPSFVLVSQDGVARETSVGAPPEREQELTQKLGGLLER